MSVLGIDLGTTYSCVARCDNSGHVEILNPQNQVEPTVPSVVSFNEDGTPIVGRTAKNRLIKRDLSTIDVVKREMNNEYCNKRLKIAGITRQISPLEASACILRHLFFNANKVLVNQYRESQSTKAVISIPAAYNDTQREKTKLAAQLAGMEVLALIQEPTAAAISYNINNNETILVFDLGGGTLDVSIVRNEFGDYRVLGVPAGDVHLGGKDWDEAMVKHVLRKLSINPDNIDKNGSDWARLMQEAEDRKKELSDTQETDFNVVLPQKNDSVAITRSEFETITSGLVQKTIDIVKKAIENSGFPEINRFVLVGGSSRMPMITKNLSKEFATRYAKGRENKEWLAVSDPDLAIAKGAAKYAGMLVKSIGNGLDLGSGDKATHSYGFQCYEKDTDKRIVLNEILSTDPIEIYDKQFELATRYENQQVIRTTIIENVHTETEFDYHDEPILLERDMDLPPNVPKGTIIYYTLNRDKNGIISVRVECQGRELEFKAKEIVSDIILSQTKDTIRKMKDVEA